MDDALIPPVELDYGIRVEAFRDVGEEYAGHCRNLAALAPNHRVLDVGCGFGPLAAGLTTFLSAEGRYDGIDYSQAIDPPLTADETLWVSRLTGADQ